jgi:DNA-binding CsgD family transcriptional regulator
VKNPVFLLLILLPFLGLAQVLPPIENYQPIDYEGGNQNWGISQAADQHIYVANNRGLLEFNGATWKRYPSPNGSIIRSVKGMGDRIYTGCFMDFGYWERDDFGNLSYTSLTTTLNIPLIEDEQFWEILAVDDWVLFQSLNRIYLYNTLEDSYHIIASKTTKAGIFKVGNTVYFQHTGQGIFKIEKGLPMTVSRASVFRENVLVGAYLVAGKTVFLTEKGRFYFLEDKRVHTWQIPFYSSLPVINVYSSWQLRDGSFVLGTVSHGIYHISPQGDLLRHIDKIRGLNDNTVLSVFEDISRNLWLALDNGISSINLEAPFRIYNDQEGKLGTVYTAQIFEDYLYLGTNHGLFYKKRQAPDDFEFVEGTSGQVWFLTDYDGTLFCGHNEGTYTIRGNRAQKIADTPGTWGLKPIGEDGNLLLQGNYSGLSVLEKKKGRWRFRNKIEGFDISSRFFESINKQELLVSHEYKGVFKLSIDSTYKKVLHITKEKEHPGSIPGMFRYQNEVHYQAENTVFRFDRPLQQFVKDSLLTANFFGGHGQASGALIADKASPKLWGFTNQHILCLEPGKFNDKPALLKVPVPEFFRRSFGISGYECLIPLEDNRYLIGTSNGYTVLNLDKLTNPQYRIGISALYKQFLNAEDQQVSLLGSPTFTAKENNLQFNFSVPEYDRFTEVSYQYKLEGMNEQWSHWFSQPTVSLKNLPYGSYIFKVRALVNGQFSLNTATYDFKIDRPWHLSNFFLFLYLFIMGFILLAIHVFYSRYFDKQKQKLLVKKHQELALTKLESEQAIMKLNNEKLENEVASKNRELASSTMILIKKNELLGLIKKELLSIKAAVPVQPVIRIINKSLTNTSDWEMFKEAFNNADSDFLKKVKAVHPKLTPNDLRLCAYLRLNLSSKEIAPLLNISVRSVEIKRYRLRKKMDLVREISLVAYILEL